MALSLSVRPFGEDGLVMRALTREHGLHAGPCQMDIQTQAWRHVLQPGVERDLVWRARAGRSAWRLDTGTG